MASIAKGVFISHIHEDAPLGQVVKEWVEDAFHAHNITAFLSSDIGDLPAGSKWLDVIEVALNQAGVLVSLISPDSIIRPWINIELGAGWIKRLPVIPVCHSGQNFRDLPRPFQDFNGIDIDAPDAAMRLIAGVGNGLSLKHSRKLGFEAFQNEMIEAARKVTSQPAKSRKPLTSVADITSKEIEILVYLARAKDAGTERPEFDAIATSLRIKRTLTELALQRLVERDLVSRILNLGSSTQRFYLTTAGLEFLASRGLLWGLTMCGCGRICFGRRCGRRLPASNEVNAARRAGPFANDLH